MTFARTPLETAIFHSGLRQIDIAKTTGIEVTWLSRIVRGRAVPTRDEKVRIAKALRKSVDELFPSREAMSA